MEPKYIKLVIVSPRNSEDKHLFCAPAWQHKLERGNTVVCDTQGGPKVGCVIDQLVVSADSEEFMFVVNGMGAKLPLRRILSKVMLNEFDYEQLKNDYKEIICLEEEPDVERGNKETESVPEASKNQEGG